MKHARLHSVNWKLIALMEACIMCLVGLMMFRYGGINLRIERTYMDTSNPLESAVYYYESPLETFSEMAIRMPGWINVRFPAEDKDGQKTLLERCAIDGMRDHVEILIKAGGDVDSSVKWLVDHKYEEAAALIREMAAIVQTQIGDTPAVKENDPTP